MDSTHYLLYTGTVFFHKLPFKCHQLKSYCHTEIQYYYVLVFLRFCRITENRNTGCIGVVILPVTFVQAPFIIARVLLLFQANDEDSDWTGHITYNIQVQLFFFHFWPG